jgi:GNAT superfamily N-acetyltransferase
MIERLSSPDLLEALDANMAGYWIPYGRGPHCTLHAGENGAWFYTGVPHPLFNGVIRAKFGADEVEAVREALQARIMERGAPALWWIGPRATPGDLGERLAAAGLQPAGEVPGMAVELGALPLDADAIPGFSVERIVGAPAQARWARIAGAGTGFSEGAIEALARIEVSLGDPQYRAQHRYIGTLDGTPVASAALVLEHGVAGVFAVATLPAARRRGIGQLMTLVPLLDARQLGYRIGVLQASSMGRPVYAKMGFSDVCSYRLFMQS